MYKRVRKRKIQVVLDLALSSEKRKEETPRGKKTQR